MGAIGNAALYLLPVRAGELVRPTLAAGEKGINLGQTAATSVIERIVDGLIVSAILFGALLTLGDDFSPQTIYKSGIAFLTIFIGSYLFIFIGIKYQEFVVNLQIRTMGYSTSSTTRTRYSTATADSCPAVLWRSRFRRT